MAKFKLGRTFYHRRMKGSDGRPLRCRVNGVCKTWKTRPEDFKLPVKYGLRECFYIEPCNVDEWSWSEHEAARKVSMSKVSTA